MRTIKATEEGQEVVYKDIGSWLGIVVLVLTGIALLFIIIKNS